MTESGRHARAAGCDRAPGCLQTAPEAEAGRGDVERGDHAAAKIAHRCGSADKTWLELFVDERVAEAPRGANTPCELGHVGRRIWREWTKGNGREEPLQVSPVEVEEQCTTGRARVRRHRVSHPRRGLERPCGRTREHGRDLGAR
jgi:hypothetical protein